MKTEDLIEEFKLAHESTVAEFRKQQKTNADLSAENATLAARITEIEQKGARRFTATGTFNGGEGQWGSAIMANPDFKRLIESKTAGNVRFKLEGKTVSAITSGNTTGGGLIAPDIVTDPVPLARQRMTVRKLLAPGRTSSNMVQMPRQTARQNNAAPVAELGSKPQSDFTMEIVDWKVRTIAHFVQASRQVMDDAPAMQSFIDAELQYGLSLAEENQLLNGDGTGENLLGLVGQATDFSAPIAVTDGTPIDTVLLALIQSEQALYPADGVVLNTLDWGKMRLQKDAQGQYILGNPASPTPPYLWGVPLVVSPSMPAGSFLAGSFFVAAQIFDRMDVEVLASTEAGTNFTTNQVTIRAEERLALATKLPSALITGDF